MCSCYCLLMVCCVCISLLIVDIRIDATDVMDGDARNKCHGNADHCKDISGYLSAHALTISAVYRRTFIDKKTNREELKDKETRQRTAREIFRLFSQCFLSSIDANYCSTLSIYDEWPCTIRTGTENSRSCSRSVLKIVTTTVIDIFPSFNKKCHAAFSSCLRKSNGMVFFFFYSSIFPG